jgi:hypothetical protein
MGTRNFQVFVVRYVGDIVRGNSMAIAICMNEIVGGDNPFLGCEHTEEWEKLRALFRDADIDFLKQWFPRYKPHDSSGSKGLLY